jgi:hypothetical protein
MTTNPMGIKGIVTIELFDEDGNLKERQVVDNLVTTAGDEYYAKKAIAGISPANPSAPTAASGMKLGTGTTAAAKSGAGAALITYESGSNNAFDTSFPTTIDEAGDGGWSASYKTTWAAGDVTEAALTEAVIVNDAATDATTSAANTYARVTFTAINKTASDSLVITWNHKFLGA